MIRRLTWSIPFAIGMLLLSGCATPDIEPAEQTFPDAFANEPTDRTNATSIPVGEPWWSIFDNPELDLLLTRIRTESPNYGVALRRIERARLQTALTRTDLFPTLGYGARATRTKNASAGSGFNGGRTRTSLEAPVTLNYELDAWGRIRRSLEAGEAEASAVEADAATLLLSLQAELASRFFALQTVLSEEQVLKRAVTIRRKARDLSQARFNAGDVSEIDIALAETELAEVESERVGLGRGRIELETGIAALIGVYPSALELKAATLAPDPPHVLPGLPSELVRRRPDVQAAEQRLEAERVRLGVARTLLFPTFALSGSIGFEAEELEDMGDADSVAWRFGAGFDGPLYQGGANRLAQELADARYRQAEDGYRAVLVEAFRESESTLGAIRVLDEQIEAFRATVAAARKAVSLTEKQYAAGLVDYFEVVNAQRTLLRNEQAVTRSLGERYQALIALIKALGGGW